MLDYSVCNRKELLTELKKTRWTEISFLWNHTGGQGCSELLVQVGAGNDLLP